MDECLIVHTASGTIEDRQRDHVLLAPRVIVEETELDEPVAGLERAFARTAALAEPRPRVARPASLYSAKARA